MPKKKKLTGRDDQSAISKKEHAKYEATLSVTYQHDRFRLIGNRPQQRSQGPQQQQSTRSTPRLYLFLQSVSGEKNTKRCDTGTNACHLLVSSVDTVHTYYDLRVAQLNNRRNDYVSPCFFVSKMYSLFFGTPSPHAIKYITDKKHVVCNRASLCVVLLIRTYITRTRVQTMSICPNLYNTNLEAPGTQPLANKCCCVAFSGAVIVITTSTSSSF